MQITPSRAHPWWKKLLLFLLQLIAFVGMATALGTLLNLLAEFLVPARWYMFEVSGLIVDWSVTLLSALGAALMLAFLQLSHGWKGLGFGRKDLGKGVGLGLLVGGGIMSVCFLILYLGGWVNIIDTRWVGSLFAGWLLFFLIQPLAEEVIMRSFLQNQVHRYFGVWPGLIACALVFGLLHAGNNNFTPLAGLQIFLGGLLIGQLFLYYQNIWAPYAMHAIWNFLQSTVLGFAVSGMETYTFLRLRISGPEWLTGGDFGIEGSLLSVVLTLAANFYFWPAARNHAPWHQEQLNELPTTTAHASDPV